MNSQINSSILILNPRRFAVEIGQIVTCSFSGRKITVAKHDSTGCVWEQIEANHPAANSFGKDHLRYIGMNYSEFQPAFIRA